jgi:hypothetical protein
LPRATEKTRVLPELGGQRGRRLAGQFGRRGVDDGDDGVDVLGEGGVERDPCRRQSNSGEISSAVSVVMANSRAV